MVIEIILIAMMGVAVAALIVSIIDMRREAVAYEALDQTEQSLLEMMAIITARQYEFGRRISELEEKNADDDR